MVIAKFFLLLPLILPITLGTSSSGGSGGGGGGGGSSANSGTSSNSGAVISNLNNNSGTNSNSNSKSNLGGIGADTVQLSSRVVHTKYGAVSGVIVHLDGRHLDPVEAFKGIPYASPPVGSLRFMPPVTGALWSNVKKADR